MSWPAWLGRKGSRRLEAAARSHPGRVREHNEDAWICEPERGLFAVIDGMGGAEAGEVAAALTREAILELAEHPDVTYPLVTANRRIVEHAALRPETAGMGCVATVARVRGRRIELAHVGDTRAYLASRAGCEQLTRDHTPLAEMQERHGLRETEAAVIAGRHQVSRDVGGQAPDEEGWVDRRQAAFEPDDVLLLCSDGVTDALPERELLDRLAEARRSSAPEAIETLVRRLIERSLEREARDNVTVVAARLIEMPEPERSEDLDAAARRLETTQVMVSPVTAAQAAPRRRWLPVLLAVAALLAAFLLGTAFGWWWAGGAWP